LKLAEIVAATVLCGEISLGSAIVVDQWVSAHESLGRNPPTPSSVAQLGP
jgi:hydroxymethylglutaryl-CoA reductase (NADPH)